MARERDGRGTAMWRMIRSFILATFLLSNFQEQAIADVVSAAAKLKSSKPDERLEGLREAKKLGADAISLSRQICDLVASDDKDQVAEAILALNAINRDLAGYAQKIFSADRNARILPDGVGLSTKKKQSEFQSLTGLICWKLSHFKGRVDDGAMQSVRETLRLLMDSGDTSAEHFNAVVALAKHCHSVKSLQATSIHRCCDSFVYFAMKDKTYKPKCIEILTLLLSSWEKDRDRAAAVSAISQMGKEAAVAIPELKKCLLDGVPGALDAIAAIEKSK